MSGIEFVPVVATGTERFATLLEHGDLDARVPSCPGWSLFDLADHLGGVHQWAGHAIVHGTPDGEPTSAPKDRAGLVAWYRESAGSLLTLLKETPEAAPAWHFGAKPRVAGWWRRRQAHEVTMHLHDARLALGEAGPIDPVLAADGVDEARRVFFPRQVRLERMPPLDRSLAVVVAETGARSVFAGDGTGPDDGEVEATVTGPAEALLLAVWKRISLDDARLTVAGDRSAAEAVLNARITA